MKLAITMDTKKIWSDFRIHCDCQSNFFIQNKKEFHFMLVNIIHNSFYVVS